MSVVPNESMTKLSHPFTFVCDVDNCAYRTAHKTQAAAFAEQTTHNNSGLCPMVGKKNYLLNEYDERGQQYTAPHMGKSLGEKLWDRLDEQVEALMNDQDNPALKGICRGLAISVHTMMEHYYPTVDDVTRQAVKRYQMFHGFIPYEPTSGYQHNPPPVGSKAYRDANAKMANVDPDENTAKKLRGTKAPEQYPIKTVSLDPVVEQKLRNALETGLFSDDDLATSFGVTPQYISALRDQS